MSNEKSIQMPISWRRLRSLWALYVREIKRFGHMGIGTVGAPVLTSLLYLAVFSVSVGEAMQDIRVYPIHFLAFLSPGLILMAMAQNAFANNTASLMIAKLRGNITDFLMAPLGNLDLLLGFTFGGVTRAFFIGIIATGVIGVFVPQLFPLYSIPVTFLFWFLGVFAIAQVGVITALWGDKFDHVAMVNNFVLTPLIFLSGTFYSLKQLPEPLQDIARVNPMFYMIDGVRYGMTGYGDADPLFGGLILVSVNLILFSALYLMLKTGYKLRS